MAERALPSGLGRVPTSALALALGIAALLFASLIPGAAVAQPAGSFSFPSSYGTPTVPSSAGAQGGQGPNVPGSAIGPDISTSQTGVQGQLGPVGSTNPGAFTVTYAPLTTRFWNGTLHPASATPAVHVTVKLTNDTTGKIFSGVTGSEGYFNTTIPEGRYILDANETGAHVSWAQALDFTSASSIIRYLIPASYTIVSVSNGDHANRASIHVEVAEGSLPVAAPQYAVTLYNGTINDAQPLGTAWSASNGSATFLGVSPLYPYTVNVIGYNSTLDDEHYFATNQSAGEFSLTASESDVFPVQITGMNSEVGASITGTALPGSSSALQAWALTTNTVVTGGSVTVSGQLYDGAAPTIVDLTLSHTVFYWNYSDGAATNDFIRLTLENSTFVFLNQGVYFSSLEGLVVGDSVVIGSAIAAQQDVQQSDYVLDFNQTVGSILENIGAPGPYQTGTGQTFRGNFVDTEFLNDTYLEFGVAVGPIAFSHVSFVDSTIPRGDGPVTQSVGFSYTRFVNSVIEPAPWENIWLNWSSFQNSTWLTAIGASNLTTLGLDAGNVFVNNTWVNLTYNGTNKWIGFNEGTGIFDHDYVGLQLASYVSLASVTTDLARFYVWEHTPGEHHPGMSFMFPSGLNASFDYFDLEEYPSTNQTYYFLSDLGVNATSDFYDDDMENDYSSAQLEADLGSPTGPPAGVNTLRDSNAKTVVITYSTLDWATGFDMQTGSNMTLAHDTIGYEDVNWWSVLQPLGAIPAGSANLELTNSTVLSYFVNASLAVGFAEYSSTVSNYPQGGFPPQFMDFAQGYGVVNSSARCTFYACTGESLVAHDTFVDRPSGLIQPEYILQDQPFINQIELDNLYENQPSPASTPTAGYAPPYACDIGYRGTWFNATGNWFLDLSNETIPFCGEPYQVNQENGQSTHARFVDNHYYFAPQGGASSLSTTELFEDHQVNLAGPKERYTGFSLPSQSLLAYGETSSTNTTIVVPDSDQMLFNTTQLEENTLYDENQWTWGIAPDVNTSTGVPDVEYQNGLESGAQPNFLWDGYNYSEEVESGEVYLAVNSAGAPNAMVTFSGFGGDESATLGIYNATTAALISASQVTTSSAGTYTASVTSASMHSGVVLELTGGAAGGVGVGCNTPFLGMTCLVAATTFAFAIVVTVPTVIYVATRARSSHA